MKTLNEIDTTAKKASKAAGFSWGIAEEIGKSIESLELFGLSGVTNLNSGKILFNDKDISNLSADKISCLGIQRTFQTPTAFNDLSVKENVTVGASFAGRSRILSSNKNMFDYVLEVIDLCQLKKYINLKASVLAILQRKQLMIATALAGMPKLLMLDEPLGGLNKDERNQMLEFLFKLKNTGISLLIIEHVMSALLNFVDEIVLLNHGKVIFTGTPKQAVNDEEVIRVYLGSEAKLLNK